MWFAPEAGLMRVSWDSLFGNLFRACPSPFGRGWREAPGEGRECTLIRPFGPPFPRAANLDTSNASPARSASAIARSLKRRRSHQGTKPVRFWKFLQFGMLICLGIVVGVWAVAQVSVARQPLSNWMPAGALLYLESSDFATQLRDWNRSEVKTRWLASKNHEQFLTTRLVLKLKEVYADFSSAAGFEPDLDELETVAGSDTALALYDLRRLDLVYISRLPSAQLGQNVLTRVRADYQRRNAAGESYFVRQSGNRTAAFAIAGDYVVVSTREDLIAAALELIRGNSAGRSINQETWYEDALRAIAGDATG